MLQPRRSPGPGTMLWSVPWRLGGDTLADEMDLRTAPRVPYRHRRCAATTAGSSGGTSSGQRGYRRVYRD